METARLFIGVPLPESYQDGLAALIGKVKPEAPGKCSWSRPGHWHITLKFLGDTLLESVPDVLEALSLVSFRPFAFRAGGGGYFPSLRHPRVLWVGATQGGREMAGLAKNIEDAMALLDFPAEERTFTVHLTVARVKSSRSGADWEKPLGLVMKALWPEIVVDRFVLWRSYLGGLKEAGGPPGPRHVPLGEYGASG